MALGNKQLYSHSTSFGVGFWEKYIYILVSCQGITSMIFEEKEIYFILISFCFAGSSDTFAGTEISHLDFYEKLPFGQAKCKLCGRIVLHMKSHFKTHKPDKRQCPICRLTMRSDNIKRHLRDRHGIWHSILSVCAGCEFFKFIFF